uniref:Ribosomal protein S20 n=1 Tax=Climaconeis cf. scalaris TaxID=2846828 RepID=A0A8F8SRE0_9STRA|nr:ribosomal protein S20 [Climaconeis cf. scalaris]
MANNKSAKKRIKINKRNYLKNRFYKSSVKTLTKIFFKNLNNYKISKTSKNLREVEKIIGLLNSLIDKGTMKNVFHKNTALRKKSKLIEYLRLSFLN